KRTPRPSLPISSWVVSPPPSPRPLLPPLSVLSFSSRTRMRCSRPVVSPTLTRVSRTASSVSLLMRVSSLSGAVTLPTSS
ncbi:hypothetical protein BGZ83_005348, partial [Gryganskiella cystojenkinii]